jgi:hypothetical protein
LAYLRPNIILSEFTLRELQKEFSWSPSRVPLATYKIIYRACPAPRDLGFGTACLQISEAAGTVTETICLLHYHLASHTIKLPITEPMNEESAYLTNYLGAKRKLKKKVIVTCKVDLLFL